MFARLFLVLLAGFLLCFVIVASATTTRSSSQVYKFRLKNPCPVTGQVTGACPGWIVDHMVPLACNAPDRPENMQWQTVAEAKAKDKVERQCWRYYGY